MTIAKGSFAFRCVAAMLAGALAGSAVARPDAPRAVSSLVIDADDGETLYASDADIVRAPASLTKMMTLFLAFDAIEAGTLRMSDRITMSRHAASQQPSKLGLLPGRSLSLRAAIEAVAVESANDVAVALAERLGGSERAFAEAMTARARSLGMRHTKFSNATGLTSRGNRTTAHDIALLSLAMLREHPRGYDYFATRSIHWANRTIANHNHLLGRVPGVDGIKTGYTVDAGYNLAASAKRHGKRLIAVVLGERSAAARDLRVSHLLEVGFAGG
ncbi:D-alanyl-D-alanine carboxypeptidase family protein [Sphingomonas bacterium]|uniref:D-alanyl-D-alanine carboxypeptidase family protein n=1 Tax=Sphingomonas bacterium TaxID=1895847 RepID=UPI0020C5CDFA|nr:D-alanyl-D-alanine carboxypeptidase family protein [Sphingomonas bacterium]